MPQNSSVVGLVLEPSLVADNINIIHVLEDKADDKTISIFITPYSKLRMYQALYVEFFKNVLVKI